VAVSDYELVSTDDGSFSLRSEHYGEAMYTMSGAFEEALLKHVIPSAIMDTASDRAAVLDVGFGLGYNSTALIESSALRNPPLFIDVTAFECDSEYLKLMKEVEFEGTRQFYHMKAGEALETGISSGDYFSIRVLKGDARQSLKSLPAICFDAVFHDPFLPTPLSELRLNHPSVFQYIQFHIQCR
jgi:protein-L-isoaspartate O-methyltransferase